ncbi:HD domain-containing protein [Candidatus Micrarchaeota archaeon]|nr:HD domain-containing protein [Candidatus Micrarchaeota archaeon]
MGYHHFRGSALTRSEKIQAKIVRLILGSSPLAEKGESSREWELKHSSGVIAFARLFAQKRGVDTELAEIAAALHDIHVVLEGTYDSHAELGAQEARKMLSGSGDFSDSEISSICEAIASHSKKWEYSNTPLAEIIKDADCLDCFMYGEKVYDYKPEAELAHYYNRIVRIRKELSLPPIPYFNARLDELEEYL